MKKIIKIFSLISFLIIFFNSSFLIAKANSSINKDKIKLENNLTYSEFINNLSNDSMINVIITFNNLEDVSTFTLPYNFENTYISSAAPYITFNIYGKNNFITQYSYIQIMNECETIKYIDIFEIIFNQEINESSNQNNNNNNDTYEWENILSDIGLNCSNIPEFNSIKIGILEGNIVNDSLECFNNITIHTNPYPNQILRYDSHTNGVCYLINKISEKILHKDIYSAQIFYGNDFVQSIVYALDWYCNEGVKIINVSWGFQSYGDMYTKMDSIFDYYAANYNMIFIKSSGNDQRSYVSLPGNSKNIITVGAINSDKSLFAKSNYSSTYMKPLIVAPGSKIGEPTFIALRSDEEGEDITSGTSFSAAITTGVIALLNAEFPNYFNNPETIITAISAGSTKLMKNDMSYEEKIGFGLINYSNTREIIINNKTHHYNSDNYTNTIIEENLIVKKYSSVDIIIGTVADRINGRVEDNITTGTSLQNGTSDIYIPRLKLIIKENDEILYEEDNIKILNNSEIIENILFAKIENMTENDMEYQLQVIMLDNIEVPISIAIREYKNYTHFETNYTHGWVTEEDNDLIEHTLISNDNNEIYYCESCDYIKVTESNIIVDPGSDWGCGSEVTLNNGDYNDYKITQGFTRILYLDETSPSTSRLDYYWESSNESVAKVSIYGTVTALDVSEPTWVVISGTYKPSAGTLNETVYYKKFLIIPDTSEEFKIYHYEVEISADGSYLFTLSEDNAPTVTFSNYYWKIPCQRDESPGVSISQWGTITAIAPGEMVIEGWCKYNPYVVISIVVTVT